MPAVTACFSRISGIFRIAAKDSGDALADSASLADRMAVQAAAAGET
jgi:hypothetical protein